MEHKRKPQAVCILTLRNFDPLTVQRKNSSKYGLPGGSIEKGETPKQAAVREFKEETGITINEENLVEVLRCDADDSGTPVITFFCKFPGGNLNPHPGEAPCQWLSWGFLTNPHFGAYPEHNKKVRKAFEQYLETSESL